MGGRGRCQLSNASGLRSGKTHDGRRIKVGNVEGDSQAARGLSQCQRKGRGVLKSKRKREQESQGPQSALSTSSKDSAKEEGPHKSILGFSVQSYVQWDDRVQT